MCNGFLGWADVLSDPTTATTIPSMRSSRKIYSAFSTPNQAYLSFAGFENVLKIFVRGVKMKVFSQFAGSTTMFLNFTRPFSRRSRRECAKTTGCICFPIPQWQTEAIFFRSVARTQCLQSGGWFPYEAQNVAAALRRHHSFSTSL